MEWEPVKILKNAIQFERGGLEAYLKYAMNTDAAHGKDMYINLALDENLHAKKLHKKLNELLSELFKKGAIGPEEAEQVFFLEASKEGEAKRGREAASDECAILEMAIENEKESREFYNRQADKSDDPILKALYRGLAREEEGHVMLLSAELDSLKGSGYWFDFREFTLEAPD